MNAQLQQRHESTRIKTSSLFPQLEQNEIYNVLNKKNLVMFVCKLRFIRKQHTKNESRVRKLKFERMMVNSK